MISIKNKIEAYPDLKRAHYDVRVLIWSYFVAEQQEDIRIPVMRQIEDDIDAE